LSVLNDLTTDAHASCASKNQAYRGSIVVSFFSAPGDELRYVDGDRTS
jgi:hypothetical protein